MTTDCAGDIAGCDMLHATHVTDLGVAKCDLHGFSHNKRAVTLLLVRPDGLILGVTRGKDIKDLGLPGGKVEQTDDNDAAAIIRETFEECSIVISNPRAIYSSLAGDFLCTTFNALWTSGIPKSSPAGAVMWATPEQFVTSACTFRGYNEALLKIAL